MRKMTHRSSRMVMWTLIFLGFITAGFPLVFQPAEPLLTYFLLAGAAVAFAGIAISARYMRCPHCHCMLNLYGGSPMACPYCGKEL